MPGKGAGDLEREPGGRIQIPIEDIDTLLSEIADKWEIMSTVEYTRGQVVRTRWTLHRRTPTDKPPF
jgi:hypothetical protein